VPQPKNKPAQRRTQPPRNGWISENRNCQQKNIGANASYLPKGDRTSRGALSYKLGKGAMPLNRPWSVDVASQHRIRATAETEGRHPDGRRDDQEDKIQETEAIRSPVGTDRLLYETREDGVKKIGVARMGGAVDGNAQPLKPRVEKTARKGRSHSRPKMAHHRLNWKSLKSPKDLIVG